MVATRRSLRTLARARKCHLSAYISNFRAQAGNRSWSYSFNFWVSVGISEGVLCQRCFQSNRKLSRTLGRTAYRRNLRIRNIPYLIARVRAPEISKFIYTGGSYHGGNMVQTIYRTKSINFLMLIACACSGCLWGSVFFFVCESLLVFNLSRLWREAVPIYRLSHPGAGLCYRYLWAPVTASNSACSSSVMYWAPIVSISMFPRSLM